MKVDSALVDDSGVLLVVDVCVNYSPLASADYFVVDNARQGAEALAAEVKRYLIAAGVRVDSTLVPFVCGATHDAANAPKRVAESVDAEVRLHPQPLWVVPALAADAAYVQALQDIATYSYQRALAEAAQAAAPATPSTDTLVTTSETALQKFVQDQRMQEAATLVRARSARSGLIYVGVTGNSLSPGKAAAFGVLRVAAGVALSIAVGPVFTAGTTRYGVIFVPGGPVDMRQMAAAVIDLRSSTPVRTKVVHGGGDPMKPDVLTDPNALGLLLRDLAFSNPGR